MQKPSKAYIRGILKISLPTLAPIEKTILLDKVYGNKDVDDYVTELMLSRRRVIGHFQSIGSKIEQRLEATPPEAPEHQILDEALATVRELEVEYVNRRGPMDTHF